MKRSICLLLIAVLVFLAGCSAQDGETVPNYSAPETSATSEATTATGQPFAQPGPNATYPTAVPSDEVIRLQDWNFIEGGLAYDYISTDQLHTTDGQELTSPCRKENCPHLDENCPVRTGSGYPGIGYSGQTRIGIRADELYAADHHWDESYHCCRITVRSTNLVTGKEKTYFDIEVEDNRELYMGEVYVGPLGIFLSYAAKEVTAHEYSTFYLYYDFSTGQARDVFSYYGTPNVWAMTPSGKLLYSVVYSSLSHNPFYNRFDKDYNDYLGRKTTTNLVLMDLTDPSPRGEHITSSLSGSGTFSTFSFGDYYSTMGSSLYYYGDGGLWAYDMETGKKDCVLTGLEITALRCLDGRIFLTTRDGRHLWYVPAGSPLIAQGAQAETLTEYDSAGFEPRWETADYFFSTDGTYFTQLLKADFYRGVYENESVTSIRCWD